MKWRGNIDLDDSSRIINVPNPSDDADAIPRRFITVDDVDPGGTWNFENGALILPKSAAEPTAPAEAQMYWDSDDDRLYIYDGTTWVDITATASPNTLDDAYDEGGAGAGRTITVDAGSVQLDSTTGNYSPLELTNRASAPSTDLAAGQVAVVDNILYIYDGTRSKWLSPSKLIGFGRAGAADGVFMLGPGDLGTTNSGWTMPRDGTIISAAGSSSGGNATKNFILGINGSQVQSANFSGGAYLNTSINIDFSAGDNIQIYVTAAGTPINDPEVTIEVAWRI